jgi:hypothetical protein
MKAIAMKCTQKQFEMIKQKLAGSIIKTKNLSNFDTYPYLINYTGQDFSIESIAKYGFKFAWEGIDEIHETWDERVFLEACDIKVDEKFEITKEQILELKNTLHKERIDYLLKEWFPKVLEPKLEIGQWMKTPMGGFYCPKEKFDKEVFGFSCYGFTPLTKSYRELFVPVSITKDDIRASLKDVEPFMISEAEKRGYKEGIYIKGLDDGKPCLLTSRKVLDIDGALNFGFDVFRNGDWAEILPAISKEEAFGRFGIIIM